MNRKWIGLLAAVVVFTVLVWLGVTQFSEDVVAAPSQCDLQGAWVSSFYGPWAKPLIMQETISPLDPAGKRLTYTMRFVNPDATFGFPFPPFDEAEYMSDLIGEANRTGRNTYDFSLVGYGVKNVDNDRGDILYILTVTGSMSCVDDQNKTDSVYLAIYLAEQDADQDGFPDKKEEPFFCVDAEPFSEAKRVPLFPACEPSPPPG